MVQLITNMKAIQILGIIVLLISITSCSTNKQVLSAHGQESDYYYELTIDRVNCENCDEID